MSLTRLLVASTLTLAAGATYAAGPAASVAQLGWMTGTWSAPAGPNTLEENWVVPSNGSMAALVRMTGATGISMWEMITIEEKEGSLVMNIQQWNAGFEPRAAKQTLELAEITENSVNFNAVSEGGMKSLGYSRDGDKFTIHLVGTNGNPVNLELSAAAR